MNSLAVLIPHGGFSFAFPKFLYSPFNQIPPQPADVYSLPSVNTGPIFAGQIETRIQLIARRSFEWAPNGRFHPPLDIDDFPLEISPFFRRRICFRCTLLLGCRWETPQTNTEKTTLRRTNLGFSTNDFRKSTSSPKVPVPVRTHREVGSSVN